ncbi:intron Large complex component GCFC2 [Indicator indicator]|uniref:intron Large complex component GCFC2 n=1 Tax=Indicator indicator TaxID=1002788 RepID=UPI0023DFB066|nr:intron Large complex component GCFC2 [Indicator indicator]
MFRRPPRNFRGRRRAASSASSSDEEPDQAAAPPSALGLSSDSEREVEPEEDDGHPGSATGSPEGARATAAEGPLCPEGPAGSPEGRATSGIGPRLAGAGPALGGKVLLSFGSEEEREGKEFFKIKKPSFNEVTFRIQKKASPLPSQTEAEESKKICQSEPTTVNTQGTCKEDEEGDESYSSPSQDYNSSASENESSSLQRRKDLSASNIPSTASIEAARRKRQLARTQADYLPLDVSNSHRVSQRRQSSDLESEDESDMKNISLAPKMRTLRQRMAEHMVTVSDESSEDEAQIKWEEQQIKKAVKFSQETYDDAYLQHLHKSQPAKPKFDPSVPLPPVDLEIVKKRLTERITSLQNVHRAHQREYEKCIEDIESSKINVRELEKSSDAVLNFKFYKGMKIYVENLINCLNEKLKYINELELAVHVLLQQRALTVLKRRQDELKNESTYIQHLTSGNDKPTNGGLEGAEKMQLLEMCEHRRTCRRQARERSGEADHHEGMSSDDELSPTEVHEFQKSKDNVVEDSRKIFEDVHADFCDIRKILLKFQEWKEKFPDSYCDAYISFCLPKLLNPLIRFQLINWNPLEVGMIFQQNFTDLEEMPWFRAIEEFSDTKNVSERDDAKNVSKRDDDHDQEVLSRVINKTILPKITAFVKSVWDPLSTSQTKNLVQLCNNVFEKQVNSKTELGQAKEDLINMVVQRMKKSIEEDVFIPLYPKRTVEDKSSLCSKFQERRFWSAVKLLSNVLLWDGIVQEDTLRGLGLNKLLNRYLLLNLLNTPPGLDHIEKCNKVVACLPERWFQGLKSGSTLPELLNFCQHLLQCARTLYKNNHSDETKEVLLLLVKVKALHIVEDFIEESKLTHLKSVIGK